MEFDEAPLLKCVFLVLSAAVSAEIKYADMMTSPRNGLGI